MKKLIGILYWFIPAFILLGWTYYEQLDAGSSVQSLTTDDNGNVIAIVRDGSSKKMISRSLGGEELQINSPNSSTSALQISNDGVGNDEGLFFGGSTNTAAIGFMAKSDGTSAFNDPAGFKMTHTEGFVIHTIGDKLIFMGKVGSEGNAFSSNDSFMIHDVSNDATELRVKADGDCGIGNICESQGNATISGVENVNVIDSNAPYRAIRVGNTVFITGKFSGLNTIGANRTRLAIDLTTLPSSFQPANNFSGTDGDSGAGTAMVQQGSGTLDNTCIITDRAGTKDLQIDCRRVDPDTGSANGAWSASYNINN